MTVWRHQKQIHLEAKERTLGRNQTCQCCHLRLLASRNVRHFYCLNHIVVVLCYCNPSKLIQVHGVVFFFFLLSLSISVVKFIYVFVYTISSFLFIVEQYFTEPVSEFHHDSALTNPTSILEDVASIPSLALSVRDLVLLWTVMQITDEAHILRCCGCGIGQGASICSRCSPKKTKKKK